MNKRITGMLVSGFLAFMVLGGCAAPQDNTEQAPQETAAQAEESAAPTETAVQSAKPTATPATPQYRTDFEIRTMSVTDAWNGWKMDERYILVKFNEDGSFADDEAIHNELLKSGKPGGMDLYYYIDADGNAQYRAYGEKYEVLYRVEPDGRETMFTGVEPLEMGVCKIELTAGAAEGDYTYKATGFVTVEQENFSREETAGNEGKTESPESTAKPAQQPTDNNGGGTSDGGNGDNTPPAPAPDSDNGGTPAPTPAPAPTPTPTPQPTEPPKQGGYAYCSCGAVLSPDEVVGHMKQHALNGESHSYVTY